MFVELYACFLERMSFDSKISLYGSNEKLIYKCLQANIIEAACSKIHTICDVYIFGPIYSIKERANKLTMLGEYP